MPESFPAGEDLGFVALSLPTGGSIWLAASSIYALETHPEEDFTTVKTMGETLGVTESPEAVFVAMKALQTDSFERSKAQQQRDAVDHIVRWGIPVELFKHDPLHLVESDDLVPKLREAGHPVRDAEGYEQGTAVPNATEAGTLPPDFGSHPRDAELATAWNKDDRGLTLASFIATGRIAPTLDEELEDDLGYDMSDALDEARRRAEQED